MTQIPKPEVSPTMDNNEFRTKFLSYIEKTQGKKARERAEGLSDTELHELWKAASR